MQLQDLINTASGHLVDQAEMLVRSMRAGGLTRFYAWRGVDRSRLLDTAATQGFSGFSFVGRTARDRLTLKMLQHVR